MFLEAALLCASLLGFGSLWFTIGIWEPEATLELRVREPRATFVQTTPERYFFEGLERYVHDMEQISQNVHL